MPTYFFDGNNTNKIKADSKIALFLDFDGTLGPIKKDPDRCLLSVKTKKQLRLLASAKQCYPSILSGRSLPDIMGRVGIRKIYYGGNHGLDISGPGIRYTHPESISARPILNDVRKQLQKEIRDIDGAWLEDKKYTLSLHFRTVRKKDIPLIEKIFYKTVGELLEKKLLAVLKGKKVLELMPNALWDKGKAALYILQGLKEDCLPIYIGDDQTDENAFEVLYKKGITIRIGKLKKTSANYYLNGSWEVSRLLKKVLELQRISLK